MKVFGVRGPNDSVSVADRGMGPQDHRVSWIDLEEESL